MSNKEIINLFISGKQKIGNPGWRLNIKDGRLFSYGQVIGEHNHNGSIAIHNSKYGKFSVTTSRHISDLISICKLSHINIKEI